MKNITDQIEKEFTPEEEEEDAEKGKKKKGKNQQGKRKGIIGGAHPNSHTQIVCVGEWAYPVEINNEGPSDGIGAPEKKEPKRPRVGSTAELERLKKLGFEVAGDEGMNYFFFLRKVICVTNKI